MIKYFKKRRKKEIQEVLTEVLKEARERKVEASKNSMVGKDLYKINIEEVTTTYDLIKIIELLSIKSTYVLSEKEAEKFDKYLYKV